MSPLSILLRSTLLLSVPLALLACGEGNESRGKGSGESMSGESDPMAAGVAAYRETPEAAESGRRIFEAQSCMRCHKETGPPGIGPNLWDDEWLYGGEPENIHQSILHGRPRGMAPYEGRLAEQEIWDLVAYLRSASKGGA